MEREIASVLRYFSFFDYPATAEEIYLFFKKPASFDRFKSILKSMIKKGAITIYRQNNKSQISNYKSISNFPTSPFGLRGTSNFQRLKQPRYTLVEYSTKKTQIPIHQLANKYQNYYLRQANSIKKLNNWRFKLYTKLISFFPQIKLVGLSGSISMMNAKEGDDIDLFIITAENRLFTGRFIALLLAQLLNLRRKRDVKARHRIFSSASPPKGGSPLGFHPQRVNPKRLTQNKIFSLFQDKACLNLFFDESNLTVPKFKQSEYVSHEVLQMKPIINKSQTYERFLQANLWVTRIFPNSIKSQITNHKSQINIKPLNFKNLNLFGTWNLGFRISSKVESILKNLQLFLINRHKTNEIITTTQLWFHPEDFEKIFLQKTKDD